MLYARIAQAPTSADDVWPWDPFLMVPGSNASTCRPDGSDVGPEPCMESTKAMQGPKFQSVCGGQPRLHGTQSMCGGCVEEVQGLVLAGNSNPVHRPALHSSSGSRGQKVEYYCSVLRKSKSSFLNLKEKALQRP